MSAAPTAPPGVRAAPAVAPPPEAAPAATPRPTLVLVAHGSKDPRHAAGVAGIADRVRARWGAPVREAYLEHNPPAATSVLGRREPTGITVLPLLLTAGFHWGHDIPPVVASDSGRSLLLPPPPLSVFAEGLIGLAREHGRSTVVAAMAGSTSARLAPRLDTLLRSVPRSSGVHLTVAPSPAAVPRAADSRSLVVPFLVADGIFGDRIRAAATATGAAVTPVFGSTEHFSAALLRVLLPAA